MAERHGTVLLLLLAGAALAGDAPRAGIPRTAKFRQGVDASIERGVAWLRKAQKDDGSFDDFPGYDGAVTALAYHTLRVCGEPRDAQYATQAWGAARRLYAREKLRTYSAALYLMAISSHGDPVAKATDDRDVHLSNEDAKWAREIAGCLAAAQDDRGCWSYFVATVADSSGSGAGAGVKPRGRPSGAYDHSNTQYALLGLKCAARCGVPVDPAVWQRSLDHFLSAQEATGDEVPRRHVVPASNKNTKGATRDAPLVDHARGWDYGERMGDGRLAYASMTAGGVSSVVICRSELLGTRPMSTKLDADSERSIWDGLAWLGTNWSPRKIDASTANPFDLYEYYGVERAGVLADVDWMAAVDWYGDGADALVAAQAKDGSWPCSFYSIAGGQSAKVAALVASMKAAQNVVSTCFALLFLKRGTAPVRRGGVTTQSGADDINFAAAANLEGKDLGDFLDLVLARWRRATDAEVRTRLFDGATSAGTRIVEPLLVRMSSDDAAARAAAHALLQHATGCDFGYVADADTGLREAALAMWQKWWMKSKERLVYDPASRRFVVR